MKMLVTGAAGQLGHNIIKEAEKRGHEAIGTDLGEKWTGLQIDITDAEAVRQAIREIRPDIVYHCAAWTAVDAAEDAGEIVFKVNAQGTRNIAEACKETDCKMVYISTDYVFNGQGTEPWQPDCKNYAPLNVYGQSKLAGEEAVSRKNRTGIPRFGHWILYSAGSRTVPSGKSLMTGNESSPTVPDTKARSLSIPCLASSVRLWVWSPALPANT